MGSVVFYDSPVKVSSSGNVRRFGFIAIVFVKSCIAVMVRRDNSTKKSSRHAKASLTDFAFNGWLGIN